MRKRRTGLEKPAARKSRLLDEHHKWLEQHGVSRSQIRDRKDASVRIIPFPSLKVKENAPLSNSFGRGSFKVGMMEKRYSESPAVRAEIERKAMSLATPYNKGALQYITPETDLTTLGRK